MSTALIEELRELGATASCSGTATVSGRLAVRFVEPTYPYTATQPADGRGVDLDRLGRGDGRRSRCGPPGRARAMVVAPIASAIARTAPLGDSATDSPVGCLFAIVALITPRLSHHPWCSRTT